MEIVLKKIKQVNTRDVLYDVKLKKFCVYPKNVDLKTFDITYIKKNCLNYILEVIFLQQAQR